jgi:hypothetical protein
MKGLLAAILAVQDIIGAIPGIRNAPDYPPDALNAFPFAVCYVSSGTWQFGPADDRKGLHTITLQVHWARKDLARDVAKAMVLAETIPDALLRNPTLAGTVDTIVQPIAYTFGPLAWGGVDTIGFDFKIPVKIQTVLT